VITATFFFFYVVLGQGLLAKIDEYSVDTEQVRTRLATLKDKVGYLESVDSDEIERLSDVLESAVFADNKAYYLLGVVRKVAADFGYEVDSFDLAPGDLVREGKKVVAKEAMPLRIRLGLIGPKAKYEDYLGALETSLPIMSIEELKTKSTDEVTYLEMGINAYFVPAKNDKKVEAIPLSELKLGEGEKELLSLLDGYKIVSRGESGPVDEGKFVKYERTDPFSQ
jgi:hypothetical protein